MIHLLAATEDGTAAVSVDMEHGARLWPTLDGTREPVVIALDNPVALAIARDADGFAIAELDEAGTARLLAVGPEGRVRKTTELAANARAIALTPRAAIVLGDDRVVELIDRDGTRHRLAPPPGVAVEDIAYRSGAALAIVSGHRAQWIDLATSRWGAPIARALPDGAEAELSADRQHLLLHRERSTWLVDLAGTAKPKEITGNCVSVDGATELCSENGVDAWLMGPEPLGVHVNVVGAIAAGGGHGIAATGGSLAIMDREHTKYLGYGVADFAHVRSAPFGLVVGDGQHRALAMDAQLNIVGTTSFADKETVHDLAFVDPHHAVATIWGETIGEPLVVLTDGARGAQLASDAIGALHFEPATGLLAFATTHGVQLAQWTGTGFAPPRPVADAPLDSDIALLDPARAHGAVLAIGVRRDGFTQLRFYTADDLARQAPGKRWRVPGTVRGVDRTGRVYVASSTNLIVAWEDGQPAVSMPPGVVVPSPDGATIAIAGEHALSLIERGGAVRWTVAAVDLGEVRWLADGQLIARFPGSLAGYDLATGAMAHRRCGWEFGMHDARIEGAISAPTACDATP